MLSTPQHILDEQIKTSVIPAVKFDIQAYDWPAKATYIKHGRFDWQKIHENASILGGKATCASDGSFIITNGGTTVRYATAPNASTDFSGWAATGAAPSTFYYPRHYAIAAHPTSNEVILFNVTPDSTSTVVPILFTLRYKKSTNYGATFDSSWTTIATWDVQTGGNQNPMYLFDICAGYKANGDMGVFFGYRGSVPSYNYYLGAFTRTSNVWTTITKLGIFGSEQDPLYNQPFCLSCFHDSSTTDWFVMIDTYELSSYINDTPKSNVGYSLFGARYNNTWKGYGTSTTPNCFPINITETSYNITSISQMSILQSSGQGPSEWLSRLTSMSDKLKNELGLNDFSISQGSTQHGQGAAIYTINNQPFMNQEFGTFVMPSVKPYAWVLKPKNMPAIASVCRYGKINFYEMRDSDTVSDGIFRTATTINSALPLQLIEDGTYIYAYNGNQIFRSRLPGEWVKPTVGTGAGISKTITQERIYSFSSNVKNEEPGTLYLVASNQDDYFDSPPAVGGSNVLYTGSRVNLHLGYRTGGVDYFVNNSDWFVESWGYARKPNEAYFILKCVDAWYLLNNYQFYDAVKFNWAEQGNVYTVYDLIKMAVNAIGGTLTYVNRSPDITSIYPRVDLSPGTTGLAFLKHLLTLVPDKIRLFGNDGQIYWPQSTNTHIYSYTGPS